MFTGIGRGDIFFLPQNVRKDWKWNLKKRTQYLKINTFIARLRIQNNNNYNSSWPLCLYKSKYRYCIYPLIDPQDTII